MKKKLILILGVVIFLGPVGVSFSQEQAAEESGKIPEWLKRTSYGASIETDQKPRFYLETVQPLYQDSGKENTVFTHGRISHQDGRGAYSIGLGYRRLFFEGLLGGINTFFDYQDLHKHYRTGVGLEAIGKVLEARSNAYFGLSPERKIGSLGQYEKAVDGFDAEFGGPIPYLPWLKVYGGYYYYDYKKFENMAGWKSRTEVKPFKFLTINLETYDDNKGDQEYRADARFTLAVVDFTPKSIFSALKPSEKAYPDVDLRERALDRVERSFTITTEKWVKTGSMFVEVKRND